MPIALVLLLGDKHIIGRICVHLGTTKEGNAEYDKPLGIFKESVDIRKGGTILPFAPRFLLACRSGSNTAISKSCTVVQI